LLKRLSACWLALALINAASAATTVRMTAFTADGAPMTNAIKQLTPLVKVTTSSGTNLIFGRTLTYRVLTNGTTNVSVAPGLYAIRTYSQIPAFDVTVTNNIPDTNDVVNEADLLTGVSLNSGDGVAYSQSYMDRNFVRQTNGAGTSNVLTTPRVFTTPTRTPTTIGQALVYVGTNGQVGATNITGGLSLNDLGNVLLLEGVTPSRAERLLGVLPALLTDDGELLLFE
jgi:hypothetical protein